MPRPDSRPRRHRRRGASQAPAELADFPGAICSRCQKPESLCVCDSVVPVANRIALLILQHPQEQDKALGSARLAALHFANATFRVGLSWASLAQALGRPADPKRWAILHLGAARPETLPKGSEVIALDAKGVPLLDQARALAAIEGAVLFDGTWSQAKTLWWRNPWVLKARRVVLAPAHPSRYGKLRKEPRAGGLSTLEAAALLIARLEGRPEIEAALGVTFERMLAKYREAAKGKRAQADMPASSASP